MPVDQISFERADIKVLERINLIVFGDGTQETYTSLIHDITPTEISINTPTSKGVEVPLLNGATVRITITREDSFYSFNTVVIKKTISGVSLIHLEKPGTVERNQRRNYLRVPVSFPVAYLVLLPEEENADGDEEVAEEPLVGTAIDIGGGGMALEVQNRERIEISTELALGFHTSNSATYDGIVAKVVNIRIRGTKAPSILCLMFTEIDEKEREEIIRFTVARQRELIKAGRTRW